MTAAHAGQWRKVLKRTCGEGGGYLTWASSPFLLFTAFCIAGGEIPTEAAE